MQVFLFATLGALFASLCSAYMLPPPVHTPMMPLGDSYPMPGTSSSDSSSTTVVQGKATDCEGLNNYIAKTFNVNRFTTSMSYHDSQNFRTLFVEDGTGLWNLYDFNEGRVYTYANNVCTYSFSQDAVMTMLDLVMGMTPPVEIDNFQGYNAYSYTVPRNSLMIKGVINSLCVEALTYLEMNGRIVTLAIYQDFQISDAANMEIETRINEARAIIAQTQCYQQAGSTTGKK